VIVDGAAVESGLKTASGRRSVPLDDHLVAVLKSHRARQAVEKLAAGRAYSEGGWLVADEVGQSLYPDTLSEKFDALVKASGLRRIRFHDARHTAASLMLADRTPVRAVAAILGHDPAMTLRVYAHVIPCDDVEAGARLSATLLGDSCSVGEIAWVVA
jgi:integrase